MPFAPDQMSLDTVKGFVDRLVRSQKNSLAPASWPPKRAQAQETIAHVLGYPSWYALHKDLSVRTQPAPGHSCPTLRLPGRLHEVGDAVKENGKLITRFVWSNAADVLVLLGPGYIRHEVLLDFAYEHSKSTPVLWLRGSLAALGTKHSPGFGFLSSNGHWLFDVVNQALTKWPASRCVDFLMGILGEGNRLSDGHDMWIGRARSLISPVMAALIYLKDHCNERLDAEVLRNALLLDHLEVLRRDTRLPLSFQDAINRYVRSLPYYKEGATRQGEQVMDMHGFVQMQFTRILGVAAEMDTGFSLGHRQILSVDDVSGNPAFNEMEMWALIEVLVELWLEDNPGGALLFDGLVPLEHFQDFLVSRLDRRVETGTRVLIATQDNNLLPGKIKRSIAMDNWPIVLDLNSKRKID